MMPHDKLSPQSPMSNDEKLDIVYRAIRNLYGDPDLPEAEGDIKEIKNHLKRINGRLDKGEDKHDKLRNTVYCLIATLVGSGVLGGSLWGALK